MPTHAHVCVCGGGSKRERDGERVKEREGERRRERERERESERERRKEGERRKGGERTCQPRAAQNRAQGSALRSSSTEPLLLSPVSFLPM